MESDVAPRTVMSVRATASFLGVSESIIRRLVRERRIPFQKIEGRYVFYRPRLERWLLDSTVEPDLVQSSSNPSQTAETIWRKAIGG